MVHVPVHSSTCVKKSHMSDKNWICPCNGCKKARKQTLLEVREILDKNLYDASFAVHLVYEKIRNEALPKDKKKNDNNTKSDN